MSDYAYLMNTATVLYIVCYIPELYANYKNKNANFWNVPEKVVILAGSSFALAYSIAIEDRALMINYVPLFALDFIAFVMRVYYACKIHREPPPALPPPVLGEGLNSVLDGMKERECQGAQETSMPSSV
jgi:uncharacterized protein with PQ loop repeat